MKHLRKFNEGVSDQSAEKLYSIFIEWISSKDFDFYDGQEDFHNKFVSISMDSSPASEKAEELTIYLDEKWGLHDGFDEVYDELEDLFSGADMSSDDKYKSMSRHDAAEEFRNTLPPEEGGPTREIEVEPWLTFMDGQDGSYSIALHGTREEAAARLGTDNPATTYDDGALEPIKFKVILKNGKYIIDPKGARVSIDG